MTTWITLLIFLILSAYTLYLHRRLKAVHEDLRYVHRSHRIRLEKLEEHCRKLEEVQKALPSAAPAMPEGPSWFSPRMTIQDALSQHPGVKEVLASMHIGGCSSCSVSSSESLAEAAEGHGVDLQEMLQKMNALMGDAPPPTVEKEQVSPEDAERKKAEDSLPPANGGRVMLGFGKVPQRES